MLNIFYFQLMGVCLYDPVQPAAQIRPTQIIEISLLPFA